MQLFTCKTSTTRFGFISNLTLCTAPSESIVEMPWIPLNSGSITGRAKSGDKGGLKLFLQLLEKPGQVPAEGFRSMFIPEASTSVCPICPSERGVPILAVVCAPGVCTRDPSIHPASSSSSCSFRSYGFQHSSAMSSLSNTKLISCLGLGWKGDVYSSLLLCVPGK